MEPDRDITERLIEKLRARFPDRAVAIGKFTHTHFASHDRSFAPAESAERIAQDVVAFLDDLFADRIELFGSRHGSGGYRRRRNKRRGFISRLLFGRQSYVWSGPLAVLLLAFLHAGAALAQKAERPDVRVGDEWRFVVYYSAPSTQPNRTWAITRVTPAGIHATENGEPLAMTPELNVLESPRTRESNPRALSFPLEVGKRWSYSSDWLFKAKGSQGTIRSEVAVVGHESITVPAGTFDAFKVVAKGWLGGTSPINSQYNAEMTTTYWYAPAARAVVKSVTHNPYLGPSTVELVTLQLARE